jgi:hypothetical protein
MTRTAAIALLASACSSPPPPEEPTPAQPVLPVSVAAELARCGECVAIAFENRMSEPWIQKRLSVSLDGTLLQVVEADEQGEMERQQFLVAPLPHGGHIASFEAVVHWRAGFGIYAYSPRPIHFTLRDDQLVTTPSQRIVTGVLYERGSVTTPLEERPALGMSAQ